MSKIKSNYFSINEIGFGHAACEVPGTNSIPAWLKVNKLFVIHSEDKGHSETGSFCSWVRGTEHKPASEAAFRVEDFTSVLQFFSSTASGPHHQSHSIRTPNLPEVHE